MSYTMANTFSLVSRNDTETEKKQKEGISDALGSLGALIFRKKKALKDQEEAAVAAEIIRRNMLSHLEGVLGLAAARKKASKDDENNAGSLLGRLLKRAGISLLNATVKPLLRFVINTARSLVRFAARAVMRYLVVPIFTAITGFVLANPITATIGASLLLGAGGYALYRRLMGSKEDVTVPSVPVSQPLVSPPVTLQQTETQPSATARVQTFFTPNVPEFTPYKPVVGGRQDKAFKGFGADMDTYIRETASKFGLDEAMLRGLVKMEGGWTGAASQTGALGPGQFTVGTWNRLISNWGGASLGMKPVTKENRLTAQDPRRDNRINMLATGLLASLNAKDLRANGLPVTGENLYMLHNIGSGIIPVMKGRAASAKTLQDMAHNGRKRDQSAAEFLEMQKRKFEYHRETANADLSTKVQPAQTVTPSSGFTVDKAIAASTAQQASVITGGASPVANPNSQIKDIVKTKNTLIGVK